MMLDDQLYGVFAIAKELGITFEDALAMPHKHILAWDVFFQRQQVEQRHRG